MDQATPDGYGAGDATGAEEGDQDADDDDSADRPPPPPPSRLATSSSCRTRVPAPRC